MDSRFHEVDSSLCEWNLDSEFQSLVVFRIPLAVFPADSKPRILDYTAKMCQIPDSTSKHFPDSGIQTSLLWAKGNLTHLFMPA